MAIPLLILIPALAMSGAGGESLSASLGIAFVKGIAIVIVILLIGRYLLRPLFHEVAGARSAELFTLAVLLVALSAAALSELIGLSMSLGACSGQAKTDTVSLHNSYSTGDILPLAVCSLSRL